MHSLTKRVANQLSAKDNSSADQNAFALAA
jgi:hypothetical protein